MVLWNNSVIVLEVTGGDVCIGGGVSEGYGWVMFEHSRQGCCTELLNKDSHRLRRCTNLFYK